MKAPLALLALLIGALVLAGCTSNAPPAENTNTGQNSDMAPAAPPLSESDFTVPSLPEDSPENYDDLSDLSSPSFQDSDLNQ